MLVETITYSKTAGWSKPFPDLDSKQTLVVVFGASEYFNDQQPFQELHDHYKQSIITGCSSSGEIFQETVCDESLAVAIVKFEKTAIKSAVVSIEDPEQSHAMGGQIADTLNDDNLQAIMIFSDGTQVNGSELVNGIKQPLNEHVIVTGGLAGDGSRFERTWILDNKPKTGHLAAIGFYGDAIEINYGCQGGWDIFGPERRITKSKNNVLYEIDGQPALELYKKYLGSRSKDLPASALLFPLAIRKSRDEEPIVRTILAIDEQTQSMTFAGDVPTGWHSQLMHASFDRLVEGSSNAAQFAAKQSEGPIDSNTLAIAISCVGRRLVLGERTEEEIDALIEELPNQTELIGFYSYGEISPSGFTTCELHNQTMTLTTIKER